MVRASFFYISLLECFPSQERARDDDAARSASFFEY
jgi:hypothetical protein